MKLALCLALAGVCMADGREAKKRFKGVELYSWQDDKGWEFVLVDGTNNEKSAIRVKNDPGAVRGVPAITKELGELAEGEWVTWSTRVPGTFLPPKDMRREVDKAAEDAALKLNVPE